MFKKDFYWGAATAAAQIEGGYKAGGREPSIWDLASGYQNRYISEKMTTFSACEHYTHFKKDVALMKEMGLKAYRFSLSWSRLIKGGTGELNPDGVRFYNELIDELLSSGIEPFVTLFHWDYPAELFYKGGWLNNDSPKWFEYYAKQVALLFSDRVKNFITINEPECFINLGHDFGEHAPFYRLPKEEVFRAGHNALKANGLASRALKDFSKQSVRVGQAFAINAMIPATSSKEDYEAAQKLFVEGEGNSMYYNWYTDAVILGQYPENRLANFGKGIKIAAGDMEIIHAKPDFVGFNTYIGKYVSSDGNGGFKVLDYAPSTDYTAMDWPITPDCLYYNAKMLYERYKLPVIITENGLALSEIPDDNGQINDDTRIQFVKQHLKGLKKAAAEGVDIDGYFYWSLLDNFEWAHGYKKRFGMIRVDYDTYARTPKKSSKWYSDVIKTNGENL